MVGSIRLRHALAALYAVALLGGCAAATPAPTQPPAEETGAPVVSATPTSTLAPPSQEPGIPLAELRGRILFGRAGGEWGDATIFTANADGTDDRRIGGFLADKTTCCPHWSPDGGHIAIVVLGPDDRLTTGIIEPDGTGLRMFELPGTFQGACTAWSPATERMACEGFHDDDPDSGGVYTVSAIDGSDPQAVVTGPAAGLGYHPAFSPDGEQLVFLGEIVGPPTGVDEGAPVASLFVVDVDGSDLHRITPEGVYSNGMARWSPDGEWILFGGLGRSGDPLRAVHPDGSGLRVVYQPEDSWAAVHPTWSPDGQFILFALDPPNTIATLSVAPPNRLCVIRVDGSDLTCIIETPDYKIWPDWVDGE